MGGEHWVKFVAVVAATAAVAGWGILSVTGGEVGAGDVAAGGEA